MNVLIRFIKSWMCGWKWGIIPTEPGAKIDGRSADISPGRVALSVQNVLRKANALHIDLRTNVQQTNLAELITRVGEGLIINKIKVTLWPI
jgi:hypothetical protein